MYIITGVIILVLVGLDLYGYIASQKIGIALCALQALWGIVTFASYISWQEDATDDIDTGETDPSTIPYDQVQAYLMADSLEDLVYGFSFGLMVAATVISMVAAFAYVKFEPHRYEAIDSDQAVFYAQPPPPQGTQYLYVATATAGPATSSGVGSTSDPYAPLNQPQTSYGGTSAKAI
eukprot:TRINITY_DN13548_c0_g1::TRINITY_DN13548_c0_g1_i1::g.22129::m.22129 TRINITY_DN13548_c0_g1::TRINITY_DN13548_c0_g1_i1::g.22129  ORF type:complete len:178 (-),score=60.85,Choline_transpo/PF04515.7/0.021,MnhB/PF04039.8/7.3e+02,MnhB/PF04039.8/0.19,MARVEL/PF01284.18/0.31,MARVEL/PF01284.18/1.7e+02,MARVEL/PF01284.18/2.4e+02 TRINITY_DN13548_c0_g1_i1:381-914(-)